MDTKQTSELIEPQGQHLIISRGKLMQIDRNASILTLTIAGETNNLTITMPDIDITTFLDAITLLAHYPKIKKVST